MRIETVHRSGPISTRATSHRTAAPSELSPRHLRDTDLSGPPRRAAVSTESVRTSAPTARGPRPRTAAPNGGSWRVWRSDWSSVQSARSARRVHAAWRTQKTKIHCYKTCAESFLYQDIPIGVYMATYSGFKRSIPALIFGFLKIGI